MVYGVITFSSMLSIAVMPFYMVESQIIKKESINRMYNPFFYQISQFITSLPGILAIAASVGVMIIIIPDLNGYGNFVLIIFMSLVVAEQMAILFSLLSKHFAIGMANVVGIYGTLMLCMGFLQRREDIPGYFIWIYWSGFFTYSLRALLFNEFKDIGTINSQAYPNG